MSILEKFSAEDIEALAKAVSTTGYDRPPVGGSPFDISPARVESLDSTVENLSFEMSELKLFSLLTAKKSSSTVQDYALLTSHGNSGTAAIPEIANPANSGATYDRRFINLKQYGLSGGYSYLAQASNHLFDPEDEEVVQRTMDLLRHIERDLFYGDSSIDPNEMDGIYAQMLDNAPSNNIIDMRNADLDQNTLMRSATVVGDSPNHGRLSHLFLTPSANDSLARSFLGDSRERWTVGKDGQFGNIGIGQIPGFMSSYGPVSFVPNSFINLNSTVPTVAIGDTANLPSAPASVVATAGAVAAPTTGALPKDQTAASQFAVADNGNYLYFVVAVNGAGESASLVSDAGTATAVTAGQQVEIAITDGSIAPLYYRVFRTTVGGDITTATEIGRILRQAGGTTHFVDRNGRLPGCSNAFALQMSPVAGSAMSSAVQLYQLLPFTKVPKGIVQTAREYMILTALGLAVKAPGRCVVYKNVRNIRP